MSDDVDLREDSETAAWLRREGQAARAGRAGCPHPDALLARRSEFVPADVRERIEAHIAGCEACARLVAGVDGLHLDEPDDAIAARVLTRVTTPRTDGLRWMLPLAAGIAVLIGAGLWWRFAPSPQVTRQMTRTAAPAAPVAPVAPVALWTIDPFPVTLAISSLDASRGARQSGAASSDLVNALLTYEHGEYAKAAEQLTAVTAAHPESSDAWLYLGVAQLMANRPADAVAPLARAADGMTANRTDAVEWYRAAADQRTGRVDAARSHLEALCGRPGDFHDRACAAVERLR